ncbi:hypothetical protein LWI29_017973 [Acer saccharum]|uniref:Uncharacterized protein n=1 Tax=Acer saccharum TaxID=4024 RepID=A0AA39VJC3_ACESA|nr:hypothetical protein LWI29_017973 [Acer saccharum]
MNLRQEQSSVSIYFTKLKTIWEELSNYRPNCSCGKCTCGGVKNLNDHHQMEYIMSFLMGLDDSFSQVRGQLLLMDPMPPINRVFSLIVQEEQQRKTNPSIDSSSSTGMMAFVVKTDVTKSGESSYRNSQNFNSSAFKNQKRDRPYCTHCKILGHTVDRCYKIHGYPLGYKFRSNNKSNAAVHQVSTSNSSDQSNLFEGFVHNLDSNQYQQLMYMFSTHLGSSAKVTNTLDQTNFSQALFVPDLASSTDQAPPDISDVSADVSSDHPGFNSSGVASTSATEIPITDIHVVTSSPSGGVLRKSTRLIHQPNYLKDYHCSLIAESSSLASTSTAYPISASISYLGLSDSHRHFVLNVSSQVEPQYYHQAVRCPEWQLAMHEELKAMEENNTCISVAVSRGFLYLCDGVLESNIDIFVLKNYGVKTEEITKTKEFIVANPLISKLQRIFESIHILNYCVNINEW